MHNGSSNNGDGSKKIKLLYVDNDSSEDEDDNQEWLPGENSNKSNDYVNQGKDNTAEESTDVSSSSGNDDDDDDDDEDYVPPTEVGEIVYQTEINTNNGTVVEEIEMYNVGGDSDNNSSSSKNNNKTTYSANGDAFQALDNRAVGLAHKKMESGDKEGAQEEEEEENDEEEDDDEGTIARRTRTKQPLTVEEEDMFFEKLDHDLPAVEEEFDFGIVDEDEEYERFKSFLVDPELFGENDVLSDSESSDDDDYAPENDQDHDGDSDNELDDDRDEMRTVSNKEWKQLIDDVRDIFNNDLSHLTAITEPSQRVSSKERKRREQMSTEEGRVYLEKLTSVTRSYLHLIIQCFFKCRCQMDYSKQSIKYRHVKLYNKLYDHLLELDKMYHGRLISNKTRVGSKRRSLLRKHVRDKKKAASENLSQEKKRAKVLSVPGLHLIPDLLRICPKSLKPVKEASRSHVSSSSASRLTDMKKSSYIPMDDEELCHFEFPSQKTVSDRKKDIALWILKYKAFEVYPILPLEYKFKIKGEAGDSETKLNNEINNKKICKAMYPIVDSYAPPGKKHVRKQRAFTQWEDDLLLLGLKKFSYKSESFESIQKYYLPGFTENGIRKYFNDIVQAKPKKEASLLSTKSKIRKWYKAMKKPHENWTREETDDLKRYFWPFIYGTSEERCTSVDHYINEFKKKYPNRSEKSIKTKYSRIKNMIPEKKNDIGKLFKEIQNGNGFDNADENNLLDNKQQTKKKKKTQSLNTTVERRRNIRESEEDQLDKELHKDSDRMLTIANTTIVDNNPCNFRDIFAETHDNNFNFGDRASSQDTAPYMGDALNQPLFITKSQDLFIDGMGTSSQTSDTSQYNNNYLSRQNSITQDLFLSSDSRRSQYNNNPLSRQNSINQNSFLSSDSRSNSLSWMAPHPHSHRSTNGEGSLIALPNATVTPSIPSSTGPITFSISTLNHESNNSSSQEPFDDGGELGFEEGGQLNDDGGGDSTTSNRTKKRKRNSDENQEINTIIISSKRHCNDDGIFVSKNSLNNLMSLSQDSNSRNDSNSSIETSLPGTSSSSSHNNESSKFFVRRSKP
jgi:hypothetical protein